jgi:iron complex outermembrane receptor protein
LEPDPGNAGEGKKTIVLPIGLLVHYQTFKSIAMSKVFALFICALALPLALFAQLSLQGKVYDAESGEPLSGAHISLETSGLRQLSNSDGSFRFTNLKPGTYHLTVTYLGYQPIEKRILLRNDITIDVAMRTASFFQQEVVISSTRLSSTSAASFTTLDKKALQTKNIGYDLPYLLTMTPSVVVNSDAGAGIGYTGIKIRGSDITRINVTLNGVPVNDPESHGVWFVNLPDLASSIENMQIQRGVGTSANGSAAFGASININTLSRSEQPFAEFTSGAGSFNTFRNTLKFGTGTTDKGLNFEGRLSKISSDGYIERGWSDLKSFYLSGSWVGARSHIHFLATSGAEKTYQAWNGIPKEMLKTNRRYNPAGEMRDAEGKLIGFYNNETDNYQQDYFQLHALHQLNPVNTITATAFLTLGRGYYENWKNNERFSKYGLENPMIGGVEVKRSDLVRQKWLDNRFQGIQLGHNFEQGNLLIRSGLGLNHYQGDHYGYIIWSRVAAVDNKTPWYFNTGSKTDLSAFSKADLKLDEKWEVFTDLHFRFIDYKIDGTHDDLRDLSQQHNFRFFNPKVGITRHLRPNKHLYIQLAIANREPNRTAYRDLDQGQVIKPERMFNLESGYRQQGNSWQLESNVYLMYYADQLVHTGKINNVGSPVFTNVSKSYRVGWENLASWAPRANLNLSGHLSLSSNRILDFVEYADNWNYWDDPANQPYQFEIKHGKTQLSFSPSAIAGINAGWKPLAPLELNFQTNYVSRQYLDNTSTKSRSIDPYAVTNFSIAYEPKIWLARQARIQINLFNLTDAKYVANGWAYRYFLDGQSLQMEGLYPQAGFHWMLQLHLLF